MARSLSSPTSTAPLITLLQPEPIRFFGRYIYTAEQPTRRVQKNISRRPRDSSIRVQANQDVYVRAATPSCAVVGRAVEHFSLPATAPVSASASSYVGLSSTLDLPSSSFDHHIGQVCVPAAAPVRPRWSRGTLSTSSKLLLYRRIQLRVAIGFKLSLRLQLERPARGICCRLFNVLRRHPMLRAPSTTPFIQRYCASCERRIVFVFISTKGTL